MADVFKENEARIEKQVSKEVFSMIVEDAALADLRTKAGEILLAQRKIRQEALEKIAKFVGLSSEEMAALL